MPVYHLSFYEAKDRYIIILKTSRWTFKGPRGATCSAVKSNLGRLRTTGDEPSPYHKSQLQKHTCTPDSSERPQQVKFGFHV